jgi:hypothetical protein
MQADDHERVTLHQRRVGMSRRIIINSRNPRAMRCTSSPRLHAGKHSNQSHPESSRFPRIPRYFVRVCCPRAPSYRLLGNVICIALGWRVAHLSALRKIILCYSCEVDKYSPVPRITGLSSVEDHVPITVLGICLLPKLRFQPRIEARQLINVGRSHAETRKTRRDWTLNALSLPTRYIKPILQTHFPPFSPAMDQFVLFGDSITQHSFSQQNGFAFGAELSDQYARRLDVIKYSLTYMFCGEGKELTTVIAVV